MTGNGLVRSVSTIGHGSSREVPEQFVPDAASWAEKMNAIADLASIKEEEEENDEQTEAGE